MHSWGRESNVKSDGGFGGYFSPPLPLNTAAPGHFVHN